MRTNNYLVLCLIYSLFFISCKNENINVKNTGQWSFNTIENPFDEKINHAWLLSEGTNRVALKVNYFTKDSSYNAYFEGVGNSTCDNKRLKIIFDDEEDVYLADAISNEFGSEWFVYSPSKLHQNIGLRDYITVEKFLILLTKHSEVAIRFQSNCGKKDFNFDISGAKNVFDYVIGDDIDLEKIVSQQEKEKEKENIKQKNLKLIYSGENFKTVLKNNGYIRTRPYYSAFLRDSNYNAMRFEQGKEIIFSECSSYSDYCKVVCYEGNELPTSVTFYVKITSLNLQLVEKIN